MEVLLKKRNPGSYRAVKKPEAAKNQASLQDKTQQAKPQPKGRRLDEALLQRTPTLFQSVDRTELKYSETKMTTAPTSTVMMQALE